MFPVEFTNALCESLGESRAERVLSALSAQPEVSVNELTVSASHAAKPAISARSGEATGVNLSIAAESRSYAAFSSGVSADSFAATETAVS